MNHRDTEDTESHSPIHLRRILPKVVQGYAGEAWNGYSYLTRSEDEQLFTVVSVAQVHDQRLVETDLIVRLVNDKIIIEHELNDKILADALMQAGVPRSQIVLAYADEKVEETV